MAERIKAWRGEGGSRPTVPVSVVSEWQTIHTAPDINDSSYRDAAALIASPNRQVIDVAGFGTTALLRVVYPSGASTGPVVRLHGGIGEDWHSLCDALGERNVALTIDLDEDDVLPDDMQATKPVALDADGASLLVLGIRFSMDASGGRVEVKVI